MPHFVGDPQIQKKYKQNVKKIQMPYFVGDPQNTKKMLKKSKWMFGLQSTLIGNCTPCIL